MKLDNKPRARRDAAKVLGVALQTRYRKLLEANGDDEIVVATGDLATCMYENVEFVIWALKSLGGMNPPPPEQFRTPSALATPLPYSMDPRFAKPPPFVLEEKKPSHCRTCETFGVDHRGTCDEEGSLSVSKKPLDLPCICPPLEAGIIGRDLHMTSCPKFVP